MVPAVNDLIGSGWRYPPSIDGRGGIALSSNEQEIEEAIDIILSTAKGQRVMRPEFGCRIHELLFAPLNVETMTAAKHYVREALGWWEPRIEVENVQVEEDPVTPACLLIVIQYSIRATHDKRALVYPFYSIPGED